MPRQRLDLESAVCFLIKLGEHYHTLRDIFTGAGYASGLACIDAAGAWKDESRAGCQAHGCEPRKALILNVARLKIIALSDSDKLFQLLVNA